MYIYTWAVATRIAYTNIWLDTYKLKREEGVMFQVWKDSRKRGIIRQTLNGKPWRRKLICIAMRPINHLFISSCPFLLHKDHVRINGRPADNTCSSYVSMCMAMGKQMEGSRLIMEGHSGHDTPHHYIILMESIIACDTVAFMSPNFMTYFHDSL